MVPYISLLLNVTFSIPILVRLEPVITTRVVNGYKVNITEVPYQGSLHRRNESGWWYLCGAAIIHKQALLTAAHCIDGLKRLLTKEYRNKKVDLLKHARINVGTSVIDSGGYNYNISSIIIHQDYLKHPTQADIAFIILVKKIEFNEKVNFIPHAPEDYVIPDGTEAIVSGFGKTEFGGPFSRVLLATTVNITNQKLCTRTFSPLVRITASSICANAAEPPRDACTGDSGGPLVANGYLIGIVSFGVECAHPVYPGVYTRVSYFYDWIDTQLIDVR